MKDINELKEELNKKKKQLSKDKEDIKRLEDAIYFMQNKKQIFNQKKQLITENKYFKYIKNNFDLNMYHDTEEDIVLLSINVEDRLKQFKIPLSYLKSSIEIEVKNIFLSVLESFIYLTIIDNQYDSPYSLNIDIYDGLIIKIEELNDDRFKVELSIIGDLKPYLSLGYIKLKYPLNIDSQATSEGYIESEVTIVLSEKLSFAKIKEELSRVITDNIEDIFRSLVTTQEIIENIVPNKENVYESYN